MFMIPNSKIDSKKVESLAETQARKFANHTHGEINDQNREDWYETACNYEQGFLEGFRMAIQTPLCMLPILREA